MSTKLQVKEASDISGLRILICKHWVRAKFHTPETNAKGGFLLILGSFSLANTLYKPQTALYSNFMAPTARLG